MFHLQMKRSKLLIEKLNLYFLFDLYLDLIVIFKKYLFHANFIFNKEIEITSRKTTKSYFDEVIKSG